MIKKDYLYAGSAAMLLVFVLVFFTTLKKPEENPIERRVSFIAAIANQGYWGRAALGAVEEGKNYGLHVKCFAQTDLDTEKLLTNLEIAMNSRVDGIITYGLNQSEEFLALQNRAAREGIPLVLIDSDVEQGERLCYIGTDNVYSGSLAGEVMCEECGGKGKILAVLSGKEVKNQIERMEGFEAALKKHPGMEVVEYLEIGSNRLLGKEKIVKALEENPEINGIFCAEGIGTGAGCQMMQERQAGAEAICVIGYDYNETVRNAMARGYITACIQQDSRRMGMLAAEVLGRYLHEGIIPPKALYTDVLLIRKENMDEAEQMHYGDVDLRWYQY